MHILLVSQGMAFPGQAGSPRAYHLAQSLSARHTITLFRVVPNEHAAEETDKYESGESPFLKTVTAIVEADATPVHLKLKNAICGNPWFVTSLKRKQEHRVAVTTLRGLCAEVDVIWVDGLWMLQYAENCGVPLVVDEIDFLSRLMLTRARTCCSGPQRLLDYTRASLVRAYEKSHLRNADAVVLISGLEAELMSQKIGMRPQVVMNGCDTSFFVPPVDRIRLDGNPSLVFVGNFPYAPNHDAARYIIDDLTPRLLRTFPATRIYLVGPLPEEGFGRLPNGVEATGFVPDVRRYYAGADVFVCPLRFGAGVKNKVLEAAAMGCPIIASEVAVEGIQFVDGVHYLQATTAEEYLERISRVLAHKGQYGQLLGRNARDMVVNEYSWDSESRKLESLLVEAAASRSG
jgi:glycosyltransferase involved in cell wall biosynthesis